MNLKFLALLAKARESHLYTWVDAYDKTLMGFISSIDLPYFTISIFSDFQWDGICVCRAEGVTEVDFSSPSIVFFGEILENEGSVALLNEAHLPSSKSAAGALKHIFEEKKMIRLHGSFSDDPFIGFVDKLTDDTVFLKYVGSSGGVSAEVTAIQIDTIHHIEYDTKYLKIFSKYAHEK